MNIARKSANDADRLVDAAREVITKESRNVAVAMIATGAVRQVTAEAGADDAQELAHAHLLIAELAMRLAERDGR